jgi:hypothetical protein
MRARPVVRLLKAFPRAVTVMAMGCIGLLGGCHPAQNGSKEADLAVSGSSQDTITAYPRASWRLAPQESLADVVLWVSVILIRHNGSDRRVPFGPGWNVEPPPPARSRGEALALAQSLAARTAAHPDQFSRLAQEHSEDVVTRETGGAMGAISATQLLVDGGSVLDALAATGPEQVTRVIETTHGFEILLRHAPPPLASVSGRAGVIPYDGAGNAFDRVAPHPARSRGEAWALARSWVDKIRADPAAFDAFVAEFPAPHAAPDGNIGKWTTREAGRWSRERERLVGLPVGAVTDPLEGPSGFAILRRTEPSDLPDYTMQVVRLDYPVGDSPEAVRLRQQASDLARSVATAAAKDAGSLAAFEKQYCCLATESWSEGRRPHAVVAAAAALAVGAVTSDPLDDGLSFVVARRVDSSSAVSVTRFELPAPTGVDAAEASRTGFAGLAVQTVVRRFGAEAASDLDLAPQDAERLVALHERFASAFDSTEPWPARQRGLVLFDEGLHSILSDDQYGKYRALADAKVSANRMKSW